MPLEGKEETIQSAQENEVWSLKCDLNPQPHASSTRLRLNVRPEARPEAGVGWEMALHETHRQMQCTRPPAEGSLHRPIMYMINTERGPLGNTVPAFLFGGGVKVKEATAAEEGRGEHMGTSHSRTQELRLCSLPPSSHTLIHHTHTHTLMTTRVCVWKLISDIMF